MITFLLQYVRKYFSYNFNISFHEKLGIQTTGNSDDDESIEVSSEDKST